VPILDRILGWILVVGGLFSAVSYWLAFHSDPARLAWSLFGCLAVLLVAALNLLRVGRPNDRPLAWVSFAASLALVALTIGYGAAMVHLADGLIHAVNAGVLVGMSLRTLVRGSRRGAA
jgi:hypothetical protein